MSSDRKSRNDSIYNSRLSRRKYILTPTRSLVSVSVISTTLKSISIENTPCNPEGSGIFIFRNIMELKNTSPQDCQTTLDGNTIVAYYSPDKIVFFLKTIKEDEGSTSLEEVGLVSSSACY
jgi:hypothetical protein